jgi:hypothetical protein
MNSTVPILTRALKKWIRSAITPPSPIPLQNLTRRASNAFNRLSEAFFYARAVDMSVLTALSTIAIEQTKVAETTMGWCQVYIKI